MTRPRRRSDANPLPQLADILSGQASADLPTLLDLIHRVNPTGRGLPTQQEAERYAQKSRLQSILIVRFHDLLVLRVVPERPGFLFIDCPPLRRHGAHVKVEALDPAAQLLVQRHLDNDGHAGQEGLDGQDRREPPAPRAPSRRRAAAPPPEPAAADLDPTLSVPELLERGDALREAYDYDGARAAFERALARDPSAVPAAARLLHLLVEVLGADQDALALRPRLTQALGAAPALRLHVALAAARLAQHGAAIELLRGAPDTPAAAVVHLILARDALTRAAYPEAEATLNRAESALGKPPPAELWAELRAARDELQRRRQSERAPHEALLTQRFEDGDEQGAAALAQDLLTRFPDSGPARRVLRSVQERQRLAAATALQAQAEALLASRPGPAVVDEAAASDQRAAAAALLRQALRQCPEGPESAEALRAALGERLAELQAEERAQREEAEVQALLARLRDAQVRSDHELDEAVGVTPREQRRSEELADPALGEDLRTAYRAYLEASEPQRLRLRALLGPSPLLEDLEALEALRAAHPGARAHGRVALEVAALRRAQRLLTAPDPTDAERGAALLLLRQSERALAALPAARRLHDAALEAQRVAATRAACARWDAIARSGALGEEEPDQDDYYNEDYDDRDQDDHPPPVPLRATLHDLGLIDLGALPHPARAAAERLRERLQHRQEARDRIGALLSLCQRSPLDGLCHLCDWSDDLERPEDALRLRLKKGLRKRVYARHQLVTSAGAAHPSELMDLSAQELPEAGQPQWLLTSNGTVLLCRARAGVLLVHLIDTDRNIIRGRAVLRGLWPGGRVLAAICTPRAVWLIGDGCAVSLLPVAYDLMPRRRLTWEAPRLPGKTPTRLCDAVISRGGRFLWISFRNDDPEPACACRGFDLRDGSQARELPRRTLHRLALPKSRPGAAAAGRGSRPGAPIPDLPDVFYSLRAAHAGTPAQVRLHDERGATLRDLSVSNDVRPLQLLCHPQRPQHALLLCEPLTSDKSQGKDKEGLALFSFDLSAALRDGPAPPLHGPLYCPGGRIQLRDAAAVIGGDLWLCGALSTGKVVNTTSTLLVVRPSATDDRAPPALIAAITAPAATRLVSDHEGQSLALVWPSEGLLQVTGLTPALTEEGRTALRCLLTSAAALERLTPAPATAQSQLELDCWPEGDRYFDSVVNGLALMLKGNGEEEALGPFLPEIEARCAEVNPPAPFGAVDLLAAAHLHKDDRLLSKLAVSVDCVLPPKEARLAALHGCLRRSHIRWALLLAAQVAPRELPKELRCHGHHLVALAALYGEASSERLAEALQHSQMAEGGRCQLRTVQILAAAATLRPRHRPQPDAPPALQRVSLMKRALSYMKKQPERALRVLTQQTVLRSRDAALLCLLMTCWERRVAVDAPFTMLELSRFWQAATLLLETLGDAPHATPPYLPHPSLSRPLAEAAPALARRLRHMATHVEDDLSEFLTQMEAELAALP